MFFHLYLAVMFPVEFEDDAPLQKLLEVVVEEVQELRSLLERDGRGYRDLICFFGRPQLYYSWTNFYDLTLQFEGYKFLVTVLMPIGFKKEYLWLVQYPLFSLRRSGRKCSIVAVHCVLVEL